MSKFKKALDLAYYLHKDQNRKGGTIPYYAHLMAVSSYVLEFGGTEDQAIAALLHDAIEDQGDKITLKEIAKDFGSEVARIVEACTDYFESSKPSWEERKQRYIHALQKKDDSVKLVVLCDKLHNIQSMNRDLEMHGSDVWNRFNAKKDRIFWYYQEILSKLETSFDHPAVKFLREEVETLERFV